MAEMTIIDAFAGYLADIGLARSPHTARTYRNALQAFSACLQDLGVSPEHTPVSAAQVEWIVDFIRHLKEYSPASERLYLSAVSGWFENLAAQSLAEVNLPQLRLLIRRRGRRPGIRLPQFPRQDIESMLEAAQPAPGEGEEIARLRALRDRALLFTLADTGLRVHEACNLRRGDLDWNEGRAVLIGKGDRQARSGVAPRDQSSCTPLHPVRSLSRGRRNTMVPFGEEDAERQTGPEPGQSTPPQRSRLAHSHAASAQ